MGFSRSDRGLWCPQKNPRLPDLKHKLTRKALWIDSWSTLAWVKARLSPVKQGRLQCHVSYDTRDSQDTARGNRYWHEHVTPGMEPTHFLNANKLLQLEFGI